MVHSTNITGLDVDMRLGRIPLVLWITFGVASLHTHSNRSVDFHRVTADMPWPCKVRATNEVMGWHDKLAKYAPDLRPNREGENFQNPPSRAESQLIMYR